MTKRPRLAVLGSVHMDLIAHASELPEKATSVMGYGFEMRPGGKGGNQAVQCAKRGAETFMVTQFGDDNFGRSLRAHLVAHHVNCSAVTLAKGKSTGASTVLSAPEGYTSIIFPGAAAAMTPDDVRSRISQLAPLDMLLLQLELPMALSLAAAEAAQAMGARIVLNASPAQQDIESLLAHTSCVVVNAAEAVALVGEANAKTVAQASKCLAVVTLGKDGCEASDGTKVWKQASHPVDARNTVGAGDAFLAGFCVALCQNAAIETALESALRAAAGHLAGG
jgi:ribokinase